MKTPVTYYPDFVADPNAAFTALRDELSWEQRDAPRQEYYCNDVPNPYVYGRGKGVRLYEPRPYHPTILAIRGKLEELTGAVFEVCFLNRYLNQSMHLGWHADDSPEMDDARPIGIVSFGAEREIWFKPKSEACLVCGVEGRDHKMSCFPTNRKNAEEAVTEKLTLGHGSLAVMAPGMQDTHKHRIPKSSVMCGERISLTFRGYVHGEAGK